MELRYYLYSTMQLISLLIGIGTTAALVAGSAEAFVPGLVRPGRRVPAAAAAVVVAPTP